MLMFVSGLKQLDIHSSTSSVVAGIGARITGSEGGPRPLGTLKKCWAAEEQPGHRLEQANLAGQWQHHNLQPFLHPCNRSQARAQPHLWPPLEEVEARSKQISWAPLEQVVEGVALVVGPPQAAPR